MEDEEEDGQLDSALLKVLGQVTSHVANETIVFARFEAARERRLPQLWVEGDSGEFEKRLNEVVEHLGASPNFFIVRTERQGDLPPADNYPYAAMREAVSVFQRARKSVLRAQIFMAGSSILNLEPGMAFETHDPAADAMFAEHARAAFWEHAETALIRLASFWDRIGQVLDFAFFNIRSFDRLGFTAVIDRLQSNIFPMERQFAESGSWKRLRAFQNNQNSDDGLRWLLQRRNLVVHSLHLHPFEPAEEDVFRSQYNHLEKAHRDKLRPREPEEEVAILVAQLGKAASLFPDFLRLLEMSPSRKVDPFVY